MNTISYKKECNLIIHWKLDDTGGDHVKQNKSEEEEQITDELAHL